MADTYEVTTPLGQKTCNSSAEVTEFINEYMQGPDASLSMVAVSRQLRADPDSGAGDICVPADFWPGPQGP